VSAVVVNYEGGEFLLDCIASLEGQDLVEIIVVDNGSADGSGPAASARFPGIKLLSPGWNLGFAGGANFGAREARGDLLLFLNPDIRMPPGSVRTLVEMFTDSHVGVVGPPLYVATSETVEYGATVDVIGSPVGVRVRTTRPLFVSGCALMTRLTLFNELGGFDGRFFMFLEDADYCWRALLRGFDVSVPDMPPVWHQGGAATPGGYVTRGGVSSTSFRVALRERNTLAMLLKCYGAPLAAIICPIYVAQSVLTASLLAACGKHRTARAVVSGLRWHMNECQNTLAYRRTVQSSREVSDAVILRRMYRGIWKLNMLIGFGIPAISEKKELMHNLGRRHVDRT
jgi:GT2 family glycosyltransferase